NLAWGLVAEYLAGAGVEFVLDPLDVGVRQRREVCAFWEVLPDEAVCVFVDRVPTSDKASQSRIWHPMRRRFRHGRRTLFRCGKGSFRCDRRAAKGCVRTPARRSLRSCQGAWRAWCIWTCGRRAT